MHEVVSKTGITFFLCLKGCSQEMQYIGYILAFGGVIHVAIYLTFSNCYSQVLTGLQICAVWFELEAKEIYIINEDKNQLWILVICSRITVVPFFSTQ